MGKRHDRTAGSRGTSSGSAPRAGGIDVLSDVLRSVRLTGSMFFLVDASAPWVTRAPVARAFAAAVLPRSQHLISYHVVTEGSCWGGLEGTTPERLDAGDILVIPHGDGYFLADSPNAPAASYDDDEAVSFFRRMAAGELPSVVSEGGGSAPRTRFICGFLGCDTHPFNPILAGLPNVMVIRRRSLRDDPMDHLIEFAIGALRERRSGSQEVLLRASELMFVEAVRRHVEAIPETQAGWLAGLRDRVVSRTLAHLHGEPERRWTLEVLASDVGASRSVLVERFTRCIGQPPMQYLSAWRMQLATRLLAEPGARVETVAAAVGYESASAFSRAFRKAVGVAPVRWRDAERSR